MRSEINGLFDCDYLIFDSPSFRVDRIVVTDFTWRQKNEMLTIYYDNQKAIVANEQTKTYKVMPKSEAAEYSKDKQTSLKPRRDLVNAMEMLLGFGYEEDKE